MAVNQNQVMALMEDQEFVGTICCMDSGEELSDSQLEGINGGVDVITAVCVIAGGVKLVADVMTEVNKSRKAKGKKTFWFW